MRGDVRGGKTEREMQRRRQLLCLMLHSIFSGASECIMLMGHNYCLTHSYEDLRMN